MTQIILCAVEYPTCDILDFDQLTATGLQDIRQQAQDLIDAIDKGDYNDTA